MMSVYASGSRASRRSTAPLWLFALAAFLSGVIVATAWAMLLWPTPTRCDVQRPVLQREPIHAKGVTQT